MCLYVERWEYGCIPVDPICWEFVGRLATVSTMSYIGIEIVCVERLYSQVCVVNQNGRLVNKDKKHS